MEKTTSPARRPLAVLVFAFAFSFANAATAAHTAVRTWESPTDKHATEGVIELHAPPAAVHAALADVSRWPSLFSDVKRTRIVRTDANGTVAEVESKALGHAHTLRVRSEDGRRVRFEVIDGHGIDLHGDFVVTQGEGGLAQVQGRLHSDVTGVFGWFASDRSVREKRQGKLLRDLEDLRSRFAGQK